MNALMKLLRVPIRTSRLARPTDESMAVDAEEDATSSMKRPSSRRNVRCEEAKGVNKM